MNRPNITHKIPQNHPRAESLKTREQLIKNFYSGAVAPAGLVAHGRGEAFDYLLGEKSPRFAIKAVRAAAAMLLLAEHPILSINGNVAALVSNNLAELVKITNCQLEINLFYRSWARIRAIKKLLQKYGIKNMLGTKRKSNVKIPELSSERRWVDKNGIFIADVVLVPLEDGDRTQALRKMGKRVIAIDLNPLSRTAQCASVTIVDNIIRAMPLLTKQLRLLKKYRRSQLIKIINEYNNQEILNESISFIAKRLIKISDVRR